MCAPLQTAMENQQERHASEVQSKYGGEPLDISSTRPCRQKEADRKANTAELRRRFSRACRDRLLPGLLS